MAVTTLIPPAALSWLGIARELTPGTPLLPTATVPVDADAYEPEDTPQFLDDDGIRDVMASLFGKVIGPEDATFAYGAPVFGDSEGYWLDNVFGDLSTVSGGTLAAAQHLSAGVGIGATSLTAASSLGAVTTGSVIQIADGAASEVVIATPGSSGTTVNFTATPTRFPHTTTATAALQTAAASYTHTFAVLNNSGGQPPTHSITDYTSLTPTVGARTYPSACATQLTLSGDSERLLAYKISGNSWLSAPASAAPTVSRQFPVPLANWRSTITVGGSQVFTTGAWAVTFTRQLIIYWTPASAQSPAVLARGDLAISGTLDYTVPADESPLANMLSGGQQAIVIAISNGLAGAAQVAMTIRMSASQFTKAKPGRAGTVTSYADAWDSVSNTTDTGGSGGKGPGTVALTNATATY